MDCFTNDDVIIHILKNVTDIWGKKGGGRVLGGFGVRRSSRVLKIVGFESHQKWHRLFSLMNFSTPPPPSLGSGAQRLCAALSITLKALWQLEI